MAQYSFTGVVPDSEGEDEQPLSLYSVEKITLNPDEGRPEQRYWTPASSVDELIDTRQPALLNGGPNEIPDSMAVDDTPIGEEFNPSAAFQGSKYSRSVVSSPSNEQEGLVRSNSPSMQRLLTTSSQDNLVNFYERTMSLSKRLNLSLNGGSIQVPPETQGDADQQAEQPVELLPEASGRNLRNRRPEQQRPYTYDQIRHRAEFLKVGLKPLRMVTGETTRVTDAADSLFVQDPDRTSVPHYMDSAGTHAVKKRKVSPKQPSLISPTSTMTPPATARRIELSDDSDYDYTFHPMEQGTVTDMPPSIAEPKIIHLDSEQENLSEGGANSSSSSDEGEAEHLFKRRLKGVLPPSFLTLKEKSGNKDSRQLRQTQRLDSFNTSLKGIARKKKGIRHTSVPQQISDSEYSSITPTKLPVNLSPGQENDVINLDDDVEQAFENDEIDRMLNYSRPALRKIHSNAQVSKSRHQSYWKNQERNYLSRRLKTNYKSRRRRRAQRNQTSVGIVDALATFHHSDADETRPIPRFLRVARRTAMTRPNFGRSVPTRKFFAFEDDQATKQTSDIIEKWTSGLFGKFKVKAKAMQPRQTVSRTQVTRGPPKTVQQSIYPKSARLFSGKSRGFRQSTLEGLSHHRRPRPQIQANLKKYRTGIGFHRRQPLDSGGESVIGQLRLRAQNHSVKADLQKQSFTMSKEAVSTSCQDYGDARTGDKGKFPAHGRAARKGNPPKRFEDCVMEVPFVFDATQISRNNESTYIDEFLKHNRLRQTSFAIHFGFQPFPLGTHFHFSTFIGSKGLDRAIATSRSLLEANEESPTLTYEFYGTKIDWQFCRPEGLQDLQSCLDEVLRATSMTTSECYNFLGFLSNVISTNLKYEANDRVSSFLDLILHFASKASDHVISDDNAGPISPNSALKYQCLVFSCVLLYQLKQLASATERESVDCALDRTSKVLMSSILSLDSSVLRRCCELQHSSFHRSQGIGRDQWLLEIWVILYHISEHNSNGSFCRSIEYLWKLGNEVSSINVVTLESGWRASFCLCLVQQMSIQGIVEEVEIQEHWDLTAHLLQASLHKAKSLNDLEDEYVRAVFSRVHSLFNDWKWRGGRQIISALYLFFTKRRLVNLKSESSNQFPRFLKSIGQAHVLELEPSDLVFHIFLKTVATAIERQTEGEKGRKEVDLLVSLITPCHGRLYPREKPLSVRDLNSLENHHSLLLTLIWKAPKACKPPFEILRSLVIIQDCHARARLVAIQAWSYFLDIQTFHQEDCQAGMTWIDEIIVASINEYRAIKKQFTRNRSTLSFEGRWNLAQLENVIMNAIEQVAVQLEKLPNSLLSCRLLLSEAVTATLVSSALILPPSMTFRLTALFMRCIEKIRGQNHVNEARKDSINDSDSQDYGDGAFLIHFLDVADENYHTSFQQILGALGNSAQQLISISLDPDNTVDDELVTTSISFWVQVAIVNVEFGFKTWGQYLNFGGEWSRITSSKRKSKFTDDLFACLLKSAPYAYLACRSSVLLQFFTTIGWYEMGNQAATVNAILNYSSDGDILRNPPFQKDWATGVYSVTRRQLEQRREILLCTVFRNMKSVMQGFCDDAALTKDTKELWVGCLQALLGRMKDSYTVMEANMHTEVGEYLKFIHTIIGSLIQYAEDFKPPLLAWFTGDDPKSTFPLPNENDVIHVNRIKAYGRKDLNDRFSCMALLQCLRARFHQTVIRRNNESAFIMQVCSAMKPERLPNGQADHQIDRLRNFICFQVFGCLTDCLHNKTYSPTVIYTCTFIVTVTRVVDDLCMFASPKEFSFVDEMVTNLLPNLCHLHVMGCTLFARILDLVVASTRLALCSGNGETRPAIETLSNMVEFCLEICSFWLSEICEGIRAESPQPVFNSIPELTSDTAEWIRRDLEQKQASEWSEEGQTWIFVQGVSRTVFAWDMSDAEAQNLIIQAFANLVGTARAIKHLTRKASNALLKAMRVAESIDLVTEETKTSLTTSIIEQGGLHYVDSEFEKYACMVL